MSFDETGPIQPKLWKTLAAMTPVILHRPLNEQRYIVRACVHSPYAFFWPEIRVICKFFLRRNCL